MNLILRNDVDEYGRPCFSRRAHCLCNDGHALAAVRALENLAGITLPRSAQLMRSLVQSLRCTQEHLLHFYQFHLSNWVCVPIALKADHHDHPGYRCPDKFRRQVYHNSLKSLKIQKLIHTAIGLLGCKNGAYAAFQMGGLPTDLDLGPRVIKQLRGLLLQCLDFICTTFLKDLGQVARTYHHWKNLAPGTAFLCLGDFVRPHDIGSLFPNAIIDPAEIGRQANCRKNLQTNPARTDLFWEDKPLQRDRSDKDHYGLNFGKNGPIFHLAQRDLHRLSAPRHGNYACESGPLARIMGAFVKGRPAVVKAVHVNFNAWGLLPRDMNSALGRLLSRGIESLVLARSALAWLDELEGVLSRENSRVSKNIRLPASGVGTGTVEVPRGTLTHTICLEKNRIVRHEYLTPSQWNFSPRDSDGRRGPLEQALPGTPIINPDHPLEILRIVQGFDPCNACHLVVKDLDTGRTTLVEG